MLRCRPHNSQPYPEYTFGSCADMSTSNNSWNRTCCQVPKPGQGQCYMLNHVYCFRTEFLPLENCYIPVSYTHISLFLENSCSIFINNMLIKNTIGTRFLSHSCLICLCFSIYLQRSDAFHVQVLLLMRNLAINLISPDYESHVSVIWPFYLGNFFKSLIRGGRFVSFTSHILSMWHFPLDDWMLCM